MQSGTVSASGTLNPVPVHWTRRKYFRRLVICFFTVAVLYAIAPILLGWAGSWLNVGEPLSSPVDYVFVLGGDADTRPFLAAAVFRAGYARSILIPEGTPPLAGDESIVLAEHQIQHAVLVNRGVPPDAIQQIPGPVDSTRDEALALANFLAMKPKSRVAIVTSDFHTRRARMIFRRILAKDRDRLCFLACPTDGFGPYDWWHYRDGILWYASEYAKLLREVLQ